MQRVAQEREMGNVYETVDEKGLDTALAIMEHEAPAKVESSGEETLSEQEQIVLQIRRGLSMRQAARDIQSHAIRQLIGMQVGTKDPQLPAATQSRAVAQLLSTKARYDWAAGKNADVSRYLAQLSDDQTAEPLGELLFRLT